MNTQPALRIVLLYMLGVALHRWVFHSIVMDEKAMQVGIGVMLMVLAAQLLITLYLLKDQMKQAKMMKGALKQGKLIQNILNVCKNGPKHKPFQRRVNKNGIYAVLLVLSGVFHAGLQMQIEAEIFALGHEQLREGTLSVVEGEIMEVTPTKNKQAYRYTIRVDKMRSFESELVFSKRLARPIQIWAYTTQAAPEIDRSDSVEINGVSRLVQDDWLEQIIWSDQSPLPTEGQELLKNKGLFLVQGFGRQERMNPGDFDQLAYLKNSEIQLQASLLGVWLDDTNPTKKLGISEVRAQGIADLTEGVHGVKYEELLAGIIWGYKHEIPSHHREIFAKLGLSHIMAVSGLHVGFVVAPFFLLIRRLNRRPRHESAGQPGLTLTSGRRSNWWSVYRIGGFRGMLVIKKALFIWFFMGIMFLYASFTGGSISVKRATMMAVFYVGTSLFFQQVNPINSMAWSAFFLILTDPKQLFAPGFQLSYLAVSFLLLAYPKLEQLFSKRWGSSKQLKSRLSFRRRLVSVTVKAIITSFFISFTLQVALLPLQLTYFDVFSVVGPWVNAFFLPLLSLCLPLAMIGSYLHLIWSNEQAFSLFLRPLDSLFDLSLRWGAGMVELPGSWVEVPRMGSILWILLVAVIIASLYVGLVRWSKWIQDKSVDRLVINRPFARVPIQGFGGYGRKRSLASSRSPLSMSLAMIVFVMMMGLLVINLRWASPTLRVIFLHVGQGDATLVQLPNGKSLLVDSGPAWYAGRSNSRSIIATLDKLGIDAIDLLIHTHPHADHIGSSKTLIEQGRVRQIAHSGYPYASNTHSEWLEKAKSMELPVLTLKQGETLNLDPRVLIRILSPSFRPYSTSVNNSSITMHLQYDDTAVLLMGDAEIELEKELIATYDSALAAQIIKIGHHGSKTSSSEGLLRRVLPDYAVISAGLNNRYSHPSPLVFDRLKNNHIPLWDLRESEALFLESNGEEWVHFDWKYRKKRNKIPINSLDKAHENAIFQD